MSQSYVPPSKQLVLEPSPVTRRLLWHPYALGTIFLDAPDHHEPYEKPGVHLFWTVSGGGTLEIQGHTYTLRSGPLVWFADMMQPRTYTPLPGKQLVIRGIRFGGPSLESWHEELGGSKHAEFRLEDASPIHYAYREAWQAVKSKSTGWEWQVHMTLTRLLGLLLDARKLLSPARSELPKPVARVLNAISANPFYDWKVKNLAPMAGVSYSGLRSLFYEVKRESLHNYIQRSRLDQARLLLSNPQLSIKQVAEHLHFSSEFYFSHFFRKWGGCSPTAFRKQLGLPMN